VDAVALSSMKKSTEKRRSDRLSTVETSQASVVAA
jgi:hypothetical protein